MDMSYATILLFREHKKLYREKRMAYAVSSQVRLENNIMYVVYTVLGYSIFYNDFHFEEELPVLDNQKEDSYFFKIQESLEQK